MKRRMFNVANSRSVRTIKNETIFRCDCGNAVKSSFFLGALEVQFKSCPRCKKDVECEKENKDGKV